MYAVSTEITETMHANQQVSLFQVMNNEFGKDKYFIPCMNNFNCGQTSCRLDEPIEVELVLRDKWQNDFFYKRTNIFPKKKCYIIFDSGDNNILIFNRGDYKHNVYFVFNIDLYFR